MKIIIKPKKITRKNFKKFGDVIYTKKIKPININDGYVSAPDPPGLGLELNKKELDKYRVL